MPATSVRGGGDAGTLGLLPVSSGDLSTRGGGQRAGGGRNGTWGGRARASAWRLATATEQVGGGVTCRG